MFCFILAVVKNLAKLQEATKKSATSTTFTSTSTTVSPAAPAHISAPAAPLLKRPAPPAPVGHFVKIPQTFTLNGPEAETTVPTDDATEQREALNLKSNVTYLQNNYDFQNLAIASKALECANKFFKPRVSNRSQCYGPPHIEYCSKEPKYYTPNFVDNCRTIMNIYTEDRAENLIQSDKTEVSSRCGDETSDERDRRDGATTPAPGRPADSGDNLNDKEDTTNK